MYRLLVILHVAAALEGFSTIDLSAREILARLMDSLEVILQVVERIRGKRAQRTLLQLQVLVRQLMLAEQKVGEIAFRAEIALILFLLEWIRVGMIVLVVLAQRHHFGKVFIAEEAVVTFVSVIGHVSLQLQFAVELFFADFTCERWFELFG